MSRWAAPDDDFDPETEDVDYAEDGEDDATVPCPHCGREVHEESQRCPYCEVYISSEDAPVRRPWWIIVGVVAGLYAVYRCMFCM